MVKLIPKSMFLRELDNMIINDKRDPDFDDVDLILRADH
jgi:hypothetical protein